MARSTRRGSLESMREREFCTRWLPYEVAAMIFRHAERALMRRKPPTILWAVPGLQARTLAIDVTHDRTQINAPIG
jgi:hypothetical protein